MIPQIRDLAVPPQPAQHLGAGAACQCVSESAHRAHACGHPPPHGDTLTATGKTKENFPCWRQKTRLWCLGGMLHVAGCIPSWNADLGGEQGDSTDTTHIPVRFPEIQLPACAGQHVPPGHGPGLWERPGGRGVLQVLLAFARSGDILGARWWLQCPGRWGDARCAG